MDNMQVTWCYQVEHDEGKTDGLWVGIPSYITKGILFWMLLH